MIFYLVTFFVSTLLLGQTASNVILDKSATSPDYPGQCYIPSTGQAYLPGSEWAHEDGLCGKARCLKTGPYLLVKYSFCSKVKTVGHRCSVVQNLELPYPGCCPSLDCLTNVKVDLVETGSRQQNQYNSDLLRRLTGLFRFKRNVGMKKKPKNKKKRKRKRKKKKKPAKGKGKKKPKPGKGGKKKPKPGKGGKKKPKPGKGGKYKKKKKPGKAVKGQTVKGFRSNYDQGVPEVYSSSHPGRNVDNQGFSNVFPGDRTNAALGGKQQSNIDLQKEFGRG